MNSDAHIKAFIIISNSRSDGLPSASTGLAIELAKNYQVIFIENPYSLIDLPYLLKEGIMLSALRRVFFKATYADSREQKNGLFYLLPFFMLPINFLPRGEIYDLFSRMNNFLFNLTYRKAIRYFKIQEFVLLNSYNPFYGRWLPHRKFKPLARLYQCRDNINYSPYVSKHGPRLEREIILKSELCFATSKAIKKYLERYSKKKVYYLPNAANLGLFNQIINKNNQKGRSNRRKVVGYIGEIATRVDFDLLEFIFKAHKDKIFYFIGPFESSTVEFLKKFENVFYQGKVEQNKLWIFLNYFNLCIIPFKKSQLTEFIYPLKLNEYLSAGLPVVTTAFSEDLNEFKEVIYLAEDYNQFSDLINKAIQDDNNVLQDHRIAFVSNNDWTNRKYLFEKILKDHLAAKSILTHHA